MCAVSKRAEGVRPFGTSQTHWVLQCRATLLLFLGLLWILLHDLMGAIMEQEQDFFEYLNSWFGASSRKDPGKVSGSLD